MNTAILVCAMAASQLSAADQAEWDQLTDYWDEVLDDGEGCRSHAMHGEPSLTIWRKDGGRFHIRKDMGEGCTMITMRNPQYAATVTRDNIGEYAGVWRLEAFTPGQAVCEYDGTMSLEFPVPESDIQIARDGNHWTFKHGDYNAELWVDPETRLPAKIKTPRGDVYEQLWMEHNGQFVRFDTVGDLLDSVDVTRLDEPIDKSACYLEHYGLAEPSGYREAKRNSWLRWLPALFGIGLVVTGVVVQRLRGRPLWSR